MYEATIEHHSISRARTVKAKTLASAKRKASAEFGDEQRDFEIVIYGLGGPHAPYRVAWRKVSGRRWQHAA